MGASGDLGDVERRINWAGRAKKFLGAGFSALDARGATAPAALLRLYQSLTRAERLAVLSVFMHLRYRPASELLFRVVRSRDSELAGVACGALAAIGGKAVRSRLCELLADSRSSAVRARAATAVAFLASRATFRASEVAILLRSLQNEAECDAVRLAAVEALGKIASSSRRTRSTYDRVIAALARQKMDNNSIVRRTAAVELRAVRAAKRRRA